METLDIQAKNENKKHYGILVWNIITIIAGLPAWIAIYFLVYPPKDGGDFSGLIFGMVMVLTCICSGSISTLIALITFYIAKRKREAIGEDRLIFTFVCLVYSISSILAFFCYWFFHAPRLT